MDGTSKSARSSHRSPDLRALALAVMQPGFVGLTPPDWVLRELEAGLGGVALFARNIDTLEQVAALNAQIHTANPRALIAVDEEAGDVTRLEHATGSSWPGNLALGVVDDVALTEAVAREIGTLLARVGIDLDYAPDADVNNNPANPVIGVRSFGADPALVARHTAAWITGLQSAGVLACAKHFPGHGDTATDSHLALPVVTLEGLEHVALQPFRAAIEAGTASIMSAHIVVQGLDDQPATLSRKVLVDLLRTQLGFTGLVLSDGMEMGGITGSMSLAEGCVRAIGAGVDLLCIGGGLADEQTVLEVAEALVAAVHDGRLEESRLVDAAQQVGRAADERTRLREAAAAASAKTAAATWASATGVHNVSGVEAAGRAIVVHGPAPTAATDKAPTVIELAAPSNIAVGDETLSGIATAVAGRWPGARTTVVSNERELLDALPGADGHNVWVGVRDPHRHAWMAPALATLLAARPDAVVIDTGWPGWTAPTGTTHVVTHGAARVTADQVVQLLAPETPSPRPGFHT
ncbi:putative beta-N-acetylhexosaminidase [Janibacter sp. HTCC2649]|uniref:glycoside hydrolase family 3 protein n=1 Tax=Janibacter sp. HTCC2649 TaxID=313589 RepID=UPI0000670858|nr:glycoside hydrolase family 3 protein [Janibacter sp. HTCC2649]EAQ00664.1 putative beta-N-acetylhexosaminidase [Janibacter sp. HTCC2649]